MSEPQGTSSREERLARVRGWLNDPELRRWSDRHIAKQCGVSPSTVAAERKRRLSSGGVIYFMQIASEDCIKIGFSYYPDLRRNRLQTGLPWAIEILATMPGDLQLEAALHSRFDHLRIRGEWFDADEELLEYIRENATPYKG